MSTLLDRADERIDPTPCVSCNRPLSTSPSDDFCSESCQQRWYATHGADLSTWSDNRPMV
ncbi:endogenous inhibitor of DNA gyrase (YacG/DUF329 family) [Saccharopolyspora phatthalungensis]|uniref:Endogenous inhibitor of DNA gyrase (YacG/DUF329 family) n=1 Tax=Saccharopolyspora phatthalungensis TaxID=664693 RepID=A0A840QDT6_9PSEU|nr:endogenous inhibitor of DNA gyrase (YacG/DUF329 family) [Saccharopolyspora phatthalungensis]